MERASSEKKSEDLTVDGVEESSVEAQSPKSHDGRTPEQAGSAIAEPLDTPPDGGYGWVVCFALALMNGMTWGIAASYGVFLSHYLATDYFPGATPLDYAFIGGLEFGAAMLISPLTTILTRELGRRVVMSAGIVMISGGYIAASFASQIWQLYLTQGVLVGLGIGAIFIPAIAVLPQWFLKRRSFAQSLASSGSGFLGLAFSLATAAMIKQLGLPWTLRVIGLLAFFGNLVSMVLVRDRNHLVKPPQLGFAIHLLKRYDCLLLLCWAFVHVMGYMVLLYSLSSYGTEVVGLSQGQAGILTAILNLGTGIGRPIIGLASDRWGRIPIASSLTLANSIIILAFWVPANSFGFLLWFALLSGGTCGVFWMTVGPLCAEVAGLKEVPSFLALQWLTVVLPTTFAEVIALYLRRPSMGRWSYVWLQLFAALCYMVGAGFIFELWRITRKKKRLAAANAGHSPR